MKARYPIHCLFQTNVGDVKIVPFIPYRAMIMCILGHAIIEGIIFNRKLKVN